jgi:hypothetical protein
MARADAELRIMSASANMQRSVADILEAKAMEMEVLRDWLTHSLHESEFADVHDMLIQSNAFHEQLLEILSGIVKLEEGFARHLQYLLKEEEELGGAQGPLGLLPYGESS